MSGNFLDELTVLMIRLKSRIEGGLTIFRKEEFLAEAENPDGSKQPLDRPGQFWSMPMSAIY